MTDLIDWALIILGLTVAWKAAVFVRSDRSGNSGRYKHWTEE